MEKSKNEVPQPVVVSNFRVNLDIRKMALAKLESLIEKKYTIDNTTTEKLNGSISQIQFENSEEKHYWQLSGRRHRNSYYRGLNKAMLTFTFGGLIGIKKSGSNSSASRTANRIAKKVKGILGLDFADNIIIYQYDSWRIWESLISNSCPINMDFEQWGMQLPVMPANGKHYLGVQKLQFKQFADKLLAMPETEILQISQTGRDWAMKHYAPVPTAMRLLGLVNSGIANQKTVLNTRETSERQ